MSELDVREGDIRYYDKFFEHPDVWVVTVTVHDMSTPRDILPWVVGTVAPSVEYAVYYQCPVVTVLLVSTMSHVHHYRIQQLFDFEGLRDCGFVSRAAPPTSAHVGQYSEESWYDGALGEMWRMRNAIPVDLSGSFLDISPIQEWIWPDPQRGLKLAPLKTLPRNVVSRSFCADLGVSTEMDTNVMEFTYFYCVDKESGFDFWLIPTNTSWMVLNGGIMVKDYYDTVRLALQTRRRPPNTCVFIECVAVCHNETFLQWFIFGGSPYADPKWPADPTEILSTFYFAGFVRVCRTSVPLSVQVQRKNFRRLMNKFTQCALQCDAALQKAACGELTLTNGQELAAFQCYNCESIYGSLPWCQSRRCKFTVCQDCLALRVDVGAFHRRCPCGQRPTALWWKIVNPEKEPFFSYTVVGTDAPATLLEQCLVKVQTMKLDRVYLSENVPDVLVRTIDTALTDARYHMD